MWVDRAVASVSKSVNMQNSYVKSTYSRKWSTISIVLNTNSSVAWYNPIDAYSRNRMKYLWFLCPTQLFIQGPVLMRTERRGRILQWWSYLSTHLLIIISSITWQIHSLIAISAMVGSKGEYYLNKAKWILPLRFVLLTVMTVNNLQHNVREVSRQASLFV